MRKLFTFLLLLVGGVISASADTWTVAGSSAVFGNDWSTTDESNDMTSEDGTVYTLTKSNITLNPGTTYKYKVVKNHSWDEAYPSSDKTFTVSETAVYDVTVTFNATSHDVSETITKVSAEVPNATITSVYISGTFNNWTAGSEMEKTGDDDVYSTTLDLSSYSSYITFKLVANGNWLGYTDLTIDAPSGWVSDEGTSTHNIKIDHPSTHYLTYTVTATWTPSTNAATGWTLKIEGKDAAPKTTYTMSFVNGAGWDEVAAYVWNGDGDSAEKLAGEWPGTQLTSSSTVTYNGTVYDVYTYSYEGYSAPENIIFNNNKPADDGGKQQTGNLTFADGTTNTDKVTFVPVYVLVGSNSDDDTDKLFFDNSWDEVSTTTTVMPESDGTWSQTFNNVTLAAQTVKFKVAKRAYLESTAVEAWYPSDNNVEMVITEDGIYNITITFDGANVSYTCTNTQETFTVGDAGWATCKTANAVDFTGVDGLKAYTATVADNTVTLNEAGAVPAGTPLVLKGTTAKAAIIESADAVTNDLKWYDNYTVNDAYAHIYGLTVSGGVAKFARVNDGETFTNKAVLEIPVSNSATTARELRVVFSGETTGIEAVAAETAAEGVYNLNGQRVTAPVKGLYIVNGKKVVLK